MWLRFHLRHPGFHFLFMGVRVEERRVEDEQRRREERREELQEELHRR